MIDKTESTQLSQSNGKKAFKTALHSNSQESISINGNQIIFPKIKQCEIEGREKYKGFPHFVDRCTEDLQYYVDLYENTVVFREWFDLVYPEITIKQALGLEEPKPDPEILKRISPPVETSLEVTTISPSIFIRGYVLNTNPYVVGVQEGVSDVTVCVVEELDDGFLQFVTFENSDNFACVATDKFGYYDISTIENIDSDGDGTGLDFKLLIGAYGYHHVVSDSNGSGTIYSFFTDTYTDISDSAPALNVYASSDIDEQRPLWISRFIMDTWHYLSDHGVDMPKADIKWEIDEISSAFNILCNPTCASGAFYWDDKIYLDGTFVGDPLNDLRGHEYEQDTIWHEYGHFVMDSTMGMPAGQNCPSPHYIHGASNEDCAWREGFANFLPLAVEDTYGLDDDMYEFYRITVSYDMENLDGNSITFATTESAEARVASALLDIHDGTSVFDTDLTYYDDVNETFENIMTVETMPATNFEAFYTNWKTITGLANVDNIMNLNTMTFVTPDDPGTLITIDYAQRISLDEITVKLTAQPTEELTILNFGLSQGTLTDVTHTRISTDVYSSFVYLDFTGLEGNPMATPRVTLTNTNFGDPEIDDDTEDSTLLDSDSDTIPDYIDSCPTEPETFNGFEDEDGCPDTVPIENQKPRADAGSNQNVFVWDLVTLDGTGSSDPNGDPFTYFWEQTDSSGYSITLSDNTAPSPTFTAPDVSSYTEIIIELTITEQTSDALDDDDNLRIFVSPISNSREPDSFIVNPDPTIDYEKFGEFMDTDPYGKSVLVGMDPVWQGFITSSDKSFNDLSESNTKAIELLFSENTVEFPDGIVFEIVDTVYDDMTSFVNSANIDLIGSISPEDKLILLVDIKNNRVSLLDSVTLHTIAFANLAGTVYLFEYDNLNEYASLDGGVGEWHEGVEFGESITLIDSDTVAIGDEDFTYSDPRIRQVGLVHVYDDISIPSELDEASFLIESPELTYRDQFGRVLANVGTDKIVISGFGLPDIYLYQKDGTLIQSYPNPTSGDFSADYMESFGNDRFVVADAGKIYVFNTTSLTPEITINQSVSSLSTNLDKNWILVGSGSSVHLFDELGDRLLDISLPNSDSVSDVSFAKNKIVVGSDRSDPNGIRDAGAVYIFSPVDGSLLESIEHDIFREEMGAQVGQIDSGKFIAVSVNGFNGDTYDSIGKVNFYSNLNNKPIANANTNLIEAFTGQTVQLDGTLSIDMDGDDLTYSWNQITYNSLYPITFDDSTLVSPSFVMPDAPIDTVFEFSLKVNDGIEDSNEDTISITVILEIHDTTRPEITLLGTTPVLVVQDRTYSDAGATCTDDTDGDITSSIVTISNVDITTIGEYQVTYNCADSAGNDATQVTRTVHVTPSEFQIIPSDSVINDNFGRSVAINGDTAIVGGHNNDDGAAYIFENISGTWIESHKLVGDKISKYAKFGHSVAIDDEIILVGIPGNYNGGKVYVYEKDGTLTRQIVSPDGHKVDEFGWSIDIDENLVLVGAPNSQNREGTAYIFERVGDTWSNVQTLVASDAVYKNKFGYFVGIDGDTLVIGAKNNDSSRGAAYVFENISGTWTETAKLVNSDGNTRDNFGYSVSLQDGTIVVGSHNDDDSGYNSGSVFIFEKVGGIWTETQKLAYGDASIRDQFGNSVVINDGVIFVGARHSDGKGAVYLFEKISETWSETEKLVASNGASLDKFGWSVAVSDGMALIGATSNENSSGSAYIIMLE